MLVVCQLPTEVLADFEDEFTVTQFLIEKRTPASDLLAALEGQEILLTSLNAVLDAKIISSMPASIQAIATYSVGTEHVDLDAARARGIAVFNTPDVLTHSVAETALLLLLGAARRATESIQLIRSNAWQGWTAQQLNGHELAGKTLGIFGMGRIGQAIARLGCGFGMPIVYSNRKRLSEADEGGARFYASPEEMLPQIDALVLATPSTAETRGFLNANRIALMHRGAMIVNIARGDLVTDEALIEALASGHLFAAGLDVFNGEPTIDPRYFQLPNVFILPHTGSSTIEARRRMGAILIEGLKAMREGRLTRNRIV
jgi:lactate dehydrogenase-like 2-hydroxyacid dehydrogenase